MDGLKKTPIFPEYKKLGAKTVDFGGWKMPVQFSGIKQEHAATRANAGLFDVSHMGEIIVEGAHSETYLQRLFTNDVSTITPGKCLYTFMCYPNGGVVDDFIVYMLKTDKYMLVVNAANIEKDMNWLIQHKHDQDEQVNIRNASDDVVLLALQGPKAEKILQTITDTDLSLIQSFEFDQSVYFTDMSEPAIVSRTGYTGEEGFEIYIDESSGRSLWNLILKKGQAHGLEPAGLGARDTLRFEAGLPLYSQELTPDITPIEAGLAFAVKVNKTEDFIGKNVLKQQIETGTIRQLAGLEMIDKGIPRHGYQVLADGEVVGEITSGTQAPTLKKNLGLALIKKPYTEVGTELLIQVRKRQLKAAVIQTPFLKTINKGEN